MGCGGVCSKCMGWNYVIFGLLLVLNQMQGWTDTWKLIGILLILKGLLKMFKPSCGHCDEMPMKKGKK